MPKLKQPTTPKVATKRWWQVTNLAEPGHAEIKLRGYIGEAKTYRDYYTGEMMENPNGAGTLAEFERELDGLANATNLQVSIFSPGGDWATGVAIHNLLLRHPATTKLCVIDGICASAATYPAMACGEIRMPSNAAMLIHEASNFAYGNAADLRAEAERLDSINNSLADLYAARTGKTAEEMRQIMAEDKWMDGTRCVELGLADTLLDPLSGAEAKAAAAAAGPVNAALLSNAPESMKALFDTPAMEDANPTNTTIMANTPPAPTPEAPAATPPADAPASAPTNAAPGITLEQLNAALAGFVKPLEDRLATAENAIRSGAAAAAGGVPPVPVGPQNEAQEEVPGLPQNATAAQKFSHGLRLARNSQKAK